jgi:hypothetical protein
MVLVFLGVAASAPAQKPRLVERDLLIPSRSGRVLGATLTLPATPHGPVGVAVVLNGSGPHFRDGNRNPADTYRPFKEIAAALSARGIATLRLDDRGVGQSTGDGDAATGDDAADDAHVAVEWLRRQPEIAAERVAVIGHSFGGGVAPIVAVADQRIAAVVLMAGPARNFRETMRYQHQYRIEHDPTVPIGRRAVVLDSLMGVQEQNVAASVQQWRQWSQDRDPLVTARRVRCPVLILHGMTDRAVSPEDAQSLTAAIRAGGNRAVTMRMFPNVNHHFQVDTLGATDGYDRLATPHLAAPVLDTLATWLERTLTAIPGRPRAAQNR